MFCFPISQLWACAAEKRKLAHYITKRHPALQQPLKTQMLYILWKRLPASCGRGEGKKKKKEFKQICNNFTSLRFQLFPSGWMKSLNRSRNYQEATETCTASQLQTPTLPQKQSQNSICKTYPTQNFLNKRKCIRETIGFTTGPHPFSYACGSAAVLAAKWP